MKHTDLLAALEEGLENGRISPQTAAYIAAELLGVEAYETGYHEWDGAALIAGKPQGEGATIELAARSLSY
jgi:hypothetical protein